MRELRALTDNIEHTIHYVGFWSDYALADGADSVLGIDIGKRFARRIGDGTARLSGTSWVDVCAITLGSLKPSSDECVHSNRAS